MSATVYTAEEWDRLNAMPDPTMPFTMHCDEGHEVNVSHFIWHAADVIGCTALVVAENIDGDRIGYRCQGQVDLAHARRHASCPCDEAAAVEELTAPVYGRVLAVVYENRA